MEDTPTDMEDPGATVSTPLARLIDSKRFTKGYVCAQLGIDYGRLSQLRRGAREMTASEIAKAATLFSVPIETFIPQEVA